MNWGAGKVILLVAFLVTLGASFPFWLAKPGADVLFHYTLIDCFSRQFWSGDMYPRWCEGANSGLGSPVFLFYFPLPYYITTLLHPLSYFGYGAEQQYAVSVMLATFVTFLTCRRWLGDIISPGRALLCAMIFIFLPYRMEVMWFRTAFAELWCIAFMPLLFMYTRRIAKGEFKCWPMLALSMLLCVLCHVPVTFIALLGCAVQLASIARLRRGPWLFFTLSGVVAACCASVYLLPAQHFLQYLHPDALEFMRSVWVNDYIEFDKIMVRVSALLGLLISVLILAGLIYMVLCRREPITDDYARREMRGWIIASVLALLLMLPISAPLWYVFYSLSGIMTPWRAQVLIPFAIIYLFAVQIQWLMSKERQKTWCCDYMALLGLFVLLSLTMLTTRPPEVQPLYKTVMDSMVINAGEYRTRWTDEKTADREHLIALYKTQQKQSKPIEKAQLIKTKGKLEVARWDSRAVAFNVDTKKGAALALKQFYFPIWRLRIDGKDSDGISPDARSGMTQIDLPAGAHEVTLTRDLSLDMGWHYTLACASSLLGTVVLGAFMYRNRRHCAKA